MTTTLTSLTSRVQAALMDTGAAVWDAGTVTEGIRLAVGEYSLAGKAAVTVSGLDSAVETTLPALHDSLIVWGAAGYAAQSRSIDRAESFELGSESPDLKAWGDARLKEFRAMLSFVFPGYLVVASTTSSSGEDPAKLAAEVALLAAQTSATGAQADLAGSQKAAIDGKLTNETSLLAAQADLVTSQAAAASAQAAAASAQAAAVSGKLTNENTLLTAQAAATNAQADLATSQAAAIDARAAAEAALLAAQAAAANAQAALIAAQADLATAQAAAVTGQEGRAARAAEIAAAEKAAETARLAGLRSDTAGKPAGKWADDVDVDYPADYGRS